MPKITRRELRSAITGMVMGDGSLYRNVNRSGQPCGHYKLDIAHSTRQENYLIAKRDIVNDLFDYTIPVTHKQVAVKGKSYPVVRICTRVHPRLDFIAKRVYIDQRKRITPWVLDNMTTKALSIWWMDDGHLRIRPPKGGEMIWGVYGFPKSDVEMFQCFLHKMFGIKFRLGKNSKMHKKNPEYGWYLYLGITKSFPILDKMARYALPDMAYKFDYSSSPAATKLSDIAPTPSI